MYLQIKQRGFTIVELLIVIVVIGILAAITIVTYSSVQQRARNSQILSGVEAYKKALMEYATDNGFYPNVGSGVCLGANYVGNQCWNGVAGNRYVSAAIDANLAKYLPTKPTVSTNILQITTNPDYRLGATLVNSPDRIIYYLEGAGQTCLEGFSGMTEMQGTQCAIIFPTP